MRWLLLSILIVVLIIEEVDNTECQVEETLMLDGTIFVWCHDEDGSLPEVAIEADSE
ncbi:hypothetical protein [Zhongshania sp.]|uniref:hypothetical protein n=1 Tax=Zhongshania sp. TaxID=1971902 RepID=UPI003561D0F5